MRFLVLVSKDAAAMREGELSLATGYPRPATETDRVVKALSHPDGRGAVPIPSAVWSWAHGCEIDLAMMLTEEEGAALLSIEDLEADGWFPSEELS